MPSWKIERRTGGRVAGVDEVGRGPVAGPVVAAAVVFAAAPPRALAALIDDSKALSAEAREAAYAALRAHARADARTEIAVGAASVAEIARLNILHASLLAMRRAVARLPAPPDHALVDGNQDPRLPCPTTCVVDGDAICLSIAAASIVAKVTRDRLMAMLARRHPAYGWERNAGYSTREHQQAINEAGPTRHHRLGFGVVRQYTLALALRPVPAPPTMATPHR